MISATPDACLPTSLTTPSFHITGMGVGPHDANAIFPYKGVWHAMHQANWTDWAHLVSTDLVHWSRLPSALFPNGDWDGSLTILNGKPVIMYDCYNVVDCLELLDVHGRSALHFCNSLLSSSLSICNLLLRISNKFSSFLSN